MTKIIDIPKSVSINHRPYSTILIKHNDRIASYFDRTLLFPDFITFLRHHIAHIENQLITPNNWVVLGGASEKHVPL